MLVTAFRIDAMRDPPPLELQCFGAPTARLDGSTAPAQVLWHKPFALLVYLALSPHRTRTRAHLYNLLWPDKPDDQARQSLNTAVSRLRVDLGADRLTSAGDALTLADRALRVDAIQFEALLEANAGAALDLLVGDFLEGFDVEGAAAFELWSAERRTHFRACGVTAWLQIGAAALDSARHGDAVSAARHALALEPFSEPAMTLLMRTQALSGDGAGALVAFHDFAARIAAELGEQPSRQLAAVAERIRSGTWRPPRPGGEAHPPLVGRAALHRTVFTMLGAGLRAGPRLLLITGDPGTGITRLLRECTDRLAIDGALVTIARPLESDQDAPWSTLRALVRAGLLKAPGSAAADPGALAVLARLAPGMTGDVGEIGAALGSVLRAVSEERPVGLAVHDAQYSDDASLDALCTAIAACPGAPVVGVVTATPPWDAVPSALHRLRSELGRALPGLEVRLEPFSEADTRELVFGASPWCASDADRERLARRVFFETNGNPFLATTLLRGLADASPLRAEVLAWPPPGGTDGSPLPISVPQMVRRAITARIAKLDAVTRRVLQAASIGSAAIDVDLVAALTEQPRPAVEDALAALERARLVVFAGDRYAIAAPLIAEVVRAEWLLPGERRILRERAIVALAARTDIDALVLRAQLAATITPGPAAFDAALSAARTALAASTRRTVRQALAAAARALPPDDPARHIALAELQAAVASQTPA
jgi:DNA-binding SARP family transcriptional activator